MKLNQHLKDWKQIVSQKFPHLSLPQVSGLATWSFGMVMTSSSSLTRVSHLIAKINTEQENTVRQRLKEWYKEGKAKAKKEHKRVSLEVKDCFAALLRWIVDLLPSIRQELPLALDATTIGQNFTVLSINVLYRGCGIPVAWKVVKATEKGSWKPYWQELFQALKNIVPTDWKVIISADRGLYAPWLYEEIVKLGWHPFLRINHQQGQYQLPNSSLWQPLAKVVPCTGTSWSGAVTCFKTNPIDCTLLARWDNGYADPWLILTDLNPTEANILWYGFRAWIEREGRWGFPSLSNHAVEDAFNTVKRLLGLSYLWTGSINGIKLQIWATWLFYAVLVDLGDAIADEISLPVDRISLEMIYRGLYYFHGASTRGEASDPVKYFADHDNQKCLGIVKRQRKPKQKLIVAPFPDKQRGSDQFFFQSSSKLALTPCLQG